MTPSLLELHRRVLDERIDPVFRPEVDDFRVYVGKMAKYLPNETEAMMRFSGALVLLSDVFGQDSIYHQLSNFNLVLGSLSALHAHDQGYDIDSFQPEYLNQTLEIGDVDIEPGDMLTVDQAVEVSRIAKSYGESTSLLHGHFRWWTPSGIGFLMNAGTVAKIPLTGVETGARTVKYKGAEPLLDDTARAAIFRALTLFPFWIDDSVPYADIGYQDMVKRISPDIYVGQSHNPPDVRQKMRERAANVPGCEYMELRNLPGMHTSEYQAIVENEHRRYHGSDGK